jgi:hypothetical protein
MGTDYKPTWFSSDLFLDQPLIPAPKISLTVFVVIMFSSGKLSFKKDQKHSRIQLQLVLIFFEQQILNRR